MEAFLAASTELTGTWKRVLMVDERGGGGVGQKRSRAAEVAVVSLASFMEIIVALLVRMEGAVAVLVAAVAVAAEVGMVVVVTLLVMSMLLQVMVRLASIPTRRLLAAMLARVTALAMAAVAAVVVLAVAIRSSSRQMRGSRGVRGAGAKSSGR